ncbi:hypothetical protein ABT142_15035 [Streptomyces sp. NPDC001857]|uniref:hypothetical protein n=1 Tax=unclassified Streptomyces TaxID=2593676 RepID=UPI00331E12F5
MRRFGARRAWLRCLALTVTAGVSSLGLPGAVAVADTSSYAFDAGAREVPAATGTADAVPLRPGTTYRSSYTGPGKAYYRFELDGASNAYLPVTAVPRPGASLAIGDGIRVAVQDADGVNCSSESVTVGAARSARPITAWGAREILVGKGLCQEAGTYYVVVERTDGRGTSDLPWELELAPVSEPSLGRPVPTAVPEVWNSATPAPVTGEAVRRAGGTGFTRATAVEQGVWRDDIRPGETLFYKVPLDWGQQLYAEAELGNAEKDTGFVAPALEMTLYNPVRSKVAETGVGYGGTQKSTSLSPLPPVRYVNRYAPAAPEKSLRFAGFYYLEVHLAAAVGERFGDGPYGLLLRVRVGGTAQPGPGYAGQSVPRGFFDVGSGDEAAGPEGVGGTGDGGGGAAMRAVAFGGIGTGSALLVGLGVWTVTARRRASAQIRASAQNPTA